MSGYCVVLVTCPDRAAGAKIAGALVEEGLAACANLLDGVTSIYQWRGEIKQDSEVLLILKTQKKKFDALAERVATLHPYEVPEVIACDITAGNANYLKWIEETTE